MFRLQKLIKRLLFGLIPLHACLLLITLLKIPDLTINVHNGMIESDRVLHVQPRQHDTDLNDDGKILALLTPPGIIGGYRNQFIRFVSLIKYAQMNNLQKILLPSLLWSTTHQAARDELKFYPVPMEFLFDVDHWNTFHGRLPILVDSIEGTSDCWRSFNSSEKVEITSMIEEEKKQRRKPKKPYLSSPLTFDVLDRSGYLTPIANQTFVYLAGIRAQKPRKIDLLPEVEHCQHPQVIGGGKGSGILWNMWEKMQINTANSDGIAELLSVAQQALRPHQKWRSLASQCIIYNLQGGDINGNIQPTSLVPPYLALHARVEVDMMLHRCGKDSEKNLTKIFDMVDSFVNEYNHAATTDTKDKLAGIFVAVSRNSMQLQTKDSNVASLSRYNLEVLNHRSPVEKGDSRLDKHAVNQERFSRERPVIIECGETWMDRWYRNQNEVPHDYYGSILPSILNFYIATQAAVFIGVVKSSWSADVWTKRYHLGKGSSNYKYTPEGIVQLPNGGLPQVHYNCRKMDYSATILSSHSEMAQS